MGVTQECILEKSQIKCWITLRQYQRNSNEEYPSQNTISHDDVVASKLVSLQPSERTTKRQLTFVDTKLEHTRIEMTQ